MKLAPASVLEASGPQSFSQDSLRGPELCGLGRAVFCDVFCLVALIERGREVKAARRGAAPVFPILQLSAPLNASRSCESRGCCLTPRNLCLLFEPPPLCSGETADWSDTFAKSRRSEARVNAALHLARRGAGP